ncbi:MAG: Fic family protein, partial [Dissulfurispiraceae bacterium]
MIVNIAGLSVNTDIDTTHKEFWTLMNLVSQVTSISSFIKELQIYPEWKAAIRKAEFARAIHGTLAIEGSDVKIEQVEKIVQEASPDSTVDKDTEVANALKAYEFIVEWSSSHPEEKIEEAVISQIHSLITRDLNYPANVPGQYRNYTVSFGDPRKESPLKTMADIQENVINLLNFINCEEEQGITMCSLPTLRAIMAHYFITIIHPFSDGNGRVARAVEALILHHYGKLEAYCFPTTAYFYYQQRKQYFELLRQVDNSKDPVSFLIFA